MTSAACSSPVGSTCAYTFRVTTGELCPGPRWPPGYVGTDDGSVLHADVVADMTGDDS